MNLIKEYFEEHNGDLTNSLISAEFTTDQARLFLPEAATGLFESCQKTSIFETVACLFSTTPYQLPASIDVGAIAKNSGMNLVKVTDGLRAIAPVLLDAFTQNKLGIDPD